MVILVTGSREWPTNDTGISLIRIALVDVMKRRYYPEKIPRSKIRVIHGAARGADTIAANICDSLAIWHSGDKYHVPKSEWNRLGKKAGVLRNQQMLDENPEIEIVLAFRIGLAKGTNDMIRRAKEAGKQVIIYDL